MKIAISAAETSGDLLGAKLVDSLRKHNPNIDIEGLAGEKMVASGCQQLWDQKLVNVMGFSEVLKKLPSLLRLRKTMIEHFSTQKPAVFIGVDAPDFNFVIEKKLKSQGIKTVHFISPSVWAWRQSRIKKIKQSTDLVLCVFPFEVDFYQKNQQKALFVGHPLAQILSPRQNYVSTKKVVLMPGSREGEVKRLLPEMIVAAKLMAEQDPELAFHLVLANDALRRWAEQQTQGLKLTFSLGDAHQRIAQADLVLVASGTATLEVALIGVPMVVVYKLSAISYFIASRLLKSPYTSLPNVIANKPLVPELIQKDANGVNIAQQAMQILNSDNQTLVEEFKAIHAQLKHDTDDEAAKAILDLIGDIQQSS
jgi:lipid-A-disaccharide synthase